VTSTAGPITNVPDIGKKVACVSLYHIRDGTSPEKIPGNVRKTLNILSGRRYDEKKTTLIPGWLHRGAEDWIGVERNHTVLLL
jgi:1-aminocyclopropane-1-carboxylate deaminase/D-cysteine desulfhydrase-like pyridoxal-dependent ACC family enzyme